MSNAKITVPARTVPTIKASDKTIIYEEKIVKVEEKLYGTVTELSEDIPGTHTYAPRFIFMGQPEDSGESINVYGSHHGGYGSLADLIGAKLEYVLARTKTETSEDGTLTATTYIYDAYVKAYGDMPETMGLKLGQYTDGQSIARGSGGFYIKSYTNYGALASSTATYYLFDNTSGTERKAQAILMGSITPISYKDEKNKTIYYDFTEEQQWDLLDLKNGVKLLGYNGIYTLILCKHFDISDEATKHDCIIALYNNSSGITQVSAIGELLPSGSSITALTTTNNKTYKQNYYCSLSPLTYYNATTGKTIAFDNLYRVDTFTKEQTDIFGTYYFEMNGHKYLCIRNSKSVQALAIKID